MRLADRNTRPGVRTVRQILFNDAQPEVTPDRASWRTEIYMRSVRHELRLKHWPGQSQETTPNGQEVCVQSLSYALLLQRRPDRSQTTRAS